MHKEVCLVPTANYAELALQLDSVGHKAAEKDSELISVATSFGRAVVASRVPERDASTWAAGWQHQANDHRYYELTHDALVHQVGHYYLLLLDHTGTTRAIFTSGQAPQAVLARFHIHASEPVGSTVR